MVNSLLTNLAPESTQRVLLHPLVLLTASDLITRHRVRGLEGPILGILLGQQQGTQVTAEHAFTAKLRDGLLDQHNDWTGTRIQQYKDVHKNPALEVVGWFTLCPSTGPLPEHAALHKQLTSLYAENGIMLAINPSEFNSTQDAKGRLPLSVYESVTENEATVNEGAMQVDGSEAATLRFRPVPYVVETDETEMIAVNYVAKGAGSAAAVAETGPTTSKKAEASSSTDAKNKLPEQKEAVSSQQLTLTPDEEDQIAGITTRLNSVKMLQDRIQLMSKLVKSIPPSYLSDQTVALSPTSPAPEHLTQLRSIQALLSRLSLLTPAGHNESEAHTQAARGQTNDVALTSLLSALGQDIQALSELGRKFSTVEQGKSAKSKGKGGFGPGGFGGLDDSDGRVPGPHMSMGLLM